MSETSAPATTNPAASQDLLLTPEFLRKLEQLSLTLTRAFAGHLHGERRSTRRAAEAGREVAGPLPTRQDQPEPVAPAARKTGHG